MVIDASQSKIEKKVLAIASSGGHYVQLKRIVQSASLESSEVFFIRTSISDSDSSVIENEYLISDVSRSNLRILPKVLRQIVSKIRELKPDVIITTGALPGLIAILVGRMFLVRTIWIDSIANTKKMSGSGTIAQYIANHCLTQWRNVESCRIKYYGKVI